MNHSELEGIKLQELNLLALEQKLKSGELKFQELEAILKDSLITINNGHTTLIENLVFPIQLQELLNHYPNEISSEKYFDYINQEDLKRTVPHFSQHFAKQDKLDICTDFQSVKEMQKDGKYNTLISSTKIYGSKLLTLHTPLKNLGVIALKIEKALELDHFMRKNYEKFASLTKTEKEILQLLALGYSNKEIADIRVVSVFTIKTHRQKINAKLEIKHFRDLLRFAQAFDLV